MLEPFRAGGVGVVEDLLAAALDRPGAAVVHRCGGVQPDPGMAVLLFGCKSGVSRVLAVSPGRVAEDVRCQRNRCGAGGRGGSSGACGRVELGYEFAVCGTGGVEVLVSFFELEMQIGHVLFEVGDFLVESVDVGWGTES